MFLITTTFLIEKQFLTVSGSSHPHSVILGLLDLYWTLFGLCVSNVVCWVGLHGGLFLVLEAHSATAAVRLSIQSVVSSASIMSTLEDILCCFKVDNNHQPTLFGLFQQLPSRILQTASDFFAQ